MKKNMIKKAVSLLMGTLFLCTVMSDIVLAEDSFPAQEQIVTAAAPEVTVCMAGPAVARDPDAPQNVIAAAAAPELTAAVSGPAVARKKPGRRNEAPDLIQNDPADRDAEAQDTALTNRTEELLLPATAAAGMDPALAYIDPNRRADENDLDKPVTWRDEMNSWIDVFIDIGSNFIPAGGTLVNYMKKRSPAKEESTEAETVINAVGDAISELVPFAEPVVAVASNVATALYKLFRRSAKPAAKPDLIG